MRADELSAESIGSGEPTAWSTACTPRAAGEICAVGREDPTPVRGLARRRSVSTVRWTAVVVGCGLGAARGSSWPAGSDDRLRRRVGGVRRPVWHDSGATYRVEDCWTWSPQVAGGFDLVVEVFTLQALPGRPRTRPPRSWSDGRRRPAAAVAFRADGASRATRVRRRPRSGLHGVAARDARARAPRRGRARAGWWSTAGARRQRWPRPRSRRSRSGESWVSPRSRRRARRRVRVGDQLVESLRDDPPGEAVAVLEPSVDRLLAAVDE